MGAKNLNKKSDEASTVLFLRLNSYILPSMRVFSNQDDFGMQPSAHHEISYPRRWSYI